MLINGLNPTWTIENSLPQLISKQQKRILHFDFLKTLAGWVSYFMQTTNGPKRNIKIRLARAKSRESEEKRKDQIINWQGFIK